MESISLYSEARQEYLKQLSTWLCGPLVEFFRKEYSSISARVGKKAMGEFQTYCSTVPLWNQDIIDQNIGLLLDNCRCDYIEDLMTAVFIAHTKMLTSIRVNSRMKKLQITLPKLDHFLHRVFTECARAFWKAPFLFSEENSPVERQKNILQAETMCVESLSAAVRGLLPIKNILRDYLEDDAGTDEVAETETAASLVAPPSPQPEVIAPVAPLPVAPLPVAPLPVAPLPAAPLPVVPLPVAPLPAAPLPAAPLPVAPLPVAPVVSEVAPILPVLIETPKVSDVAAAAAAVAVVPAEPETKKEKKEKKAEKILIEKLETQPSIETPPPSEHSVKLAEPVKQDTPLMKIDTEPSVHFTPYDSVVYDNNVTSIEYKEKISVEDKPESTFGMDDDVPRLTIGSSSSSIDLSDITELDKVPDVVAPLGSTEDFETL